MSDELTARTAAEWRRERAAADGGHKKPNGGFARAKSNGDGSEHDAGPRDDATPIGEPIRDWSKEPPPSRDDLLLSAWLTRDLPPRDYLLGNVFCTTSRWLIFGDTGIGKTLFAMSMAGAMASGNSFLAWDGRHKTRVMYLDGEMPDETFKERMQLLADECGPGLALFGYNRDVLGPDEMPPLNTPEGEAWLMREIAAVKPDIIIFDSIMSLLAGVMGEEESWAPVKLLIRKISSKRIGQIWLHHTGHDTTRGFGTKTREWEMDTVLSLATTPDEQGVLAEFRKARLRTPQTADQFKPRIIARDPHGWTTTGDGMATPKEKRTRSEIDNLKLALLDAYHRLADGAEATPGFDGKPARKVKVERLRDELKARGFLEAKDSGGLTDLSRQHFQRAKAALLSPPKPTLIERDGLIWK
jgi:hypothetical protein